MFGKKQAAKGGLGKTVLVLDIEGGSVATALVRLTGKNDTNPQILSYQRQHLPLKQTRPGSQMTGLLEQTLAHSLQHVAEVAARMRVHAPEQGLGIITSAVVFLAAPWGTPNLATGKPEYVPGMREFVAAQIHASMGDVPVVFYTSADAIAYGARAAGKDADTIVASLRGELLELLLLNDAGTRGYSTAPAGSRDILRTLQAHGSLTEHEARSMLALAQHQNHTHYEPLYAAGKHLNSNFAQGVELLLPGGPAASVLVISEHPLGEWFAKNLAQDESLSALFIPDSTVEALRPHHMQGLVEPGRVTDTFILLEAAFVKVLY